MSIVFYGHDREPSGTYYRGTNSIAYGFSLYPPQTIQSTAGPLLHVRVSENRGALFWGPYNKDPTISGAILGSRLI